MFIYGSERKIDSFEALEELVILSVTQDLFLSPLP